MSTAPSDPFLVISMGTRPWTAALQMFPQAGAGFFERDPLHEQNVHCVLLVACKGVLQTPEPPAGRLVLHARPRWVIELFLSVIGLGRATVSACPTPRR